MSIVAKRRGSKLYYYAVHRDTLPDGRTKFSYCYLGPRYYTYVKKTHQDYDIDFKGAIEELEGFPRASSYLSELAVTLKRQIRAGTLPARKALELYTSLILSATYAKGGAPPAPVFIPMPLQQQGAENPKTKGPQ